MKYKGWIVLGVLAFIVIFMVAIPLVSYGNSEADLRTNVEASQKANQVVYDRVWKTIQQQAGVTDKYQESFRGIMYTGARNVALECLKGLGVKIED